MLVESDLFVPQFPTDMPSFVCAHRGEVFRYLTYKKLFTPYEQDGKFIDESQFEDIQYSFGILTNAISLGSGDWLLSFRDVDLGYSEEYGDDTLEETERTVFRRLSDIQLCQFDGDGDSMNVVPYKPNEEPDFS